MRLRRTYFVMAVWLVLACQQDEARASDAATAYAIPLTGIQIDGDLRDWPEGMIQYPILKNTNAYGPTDLDGTDLRTSADLSASFRVGYDREASLIYLAVQVRDDSLVVGGSDPLHTDALEVYVDGDHSGGTLQGDWRAAPATDLPALQYVAIPGPGTYGNASGQGHVGNPSMKGGQVEKTRTLMAYSRQGDTTVYEWAIEAFDRYPDEATRLSSGKTIGFDLAVVDVDEAGGMDVSAWIVWGPPVGLKFMRADTLGDLVLIESYAQLATVSGKVVGKKERQPYARIAVEMIRNDDTVRTTPTDDAGAFALWTVPGTYTLRVPVGQGVEETQITLEVEAGQETSIDIGVTPLRLPEELARSMAVYQSARGYRDTTVVETREVQPGMDTRRTTRTVFALERPNRVLLESNILWMQGKTRMVSDGTTLVSLHQSFQTEGKEQYQEARAPEKLSAGDLQLATPDRPGRGILQQLLLNDDPARALMKGPEVTEKVGRDKLDGVPVTIFRLTPAPSGLTASLMPPGPDMAMTLQLWVGQKDHLIRRAIVEGQAQVDPQVPEEQRAWLAESRTVITEDHVGIQLEPEFPDVLFAATVPEGAELVEQFGPAADGSSQTDLVGKPAPGFTLKDVDDKDVSLSDSRGTW